MATRLTEDIVGWKVCATVVRKTLDQPLEDVYEIQPIYVKLNIKKGTRCTNGKPVVNRKMSINEENGQYGIIDEHLGITKYRCAIAKVEGLYDSDFNRLPNDALASSLFFSDYLYWVGKTVFPSEKFDDNEDRTCGSGIHFFKTKEEAVKYADKFVGDTLHFWKTVSITKSLYVYRAFEAYYKHCNSYKRRIWK